MSEREVVITKVITTGSSGQQIAICTATSWRGPRCMLNAGHDGWHMNFSTNGTLAWGNAHEGRQG